MTAITSSNKRLTRDNRTPAPAVKEDGSNYPLRMFYNYGQNIVDADTHEELLDFLVADYSLLTVDEKKQARINLARNVQQTARAVILANITPDQAEALTEWEWKILNYGEGDNYDPSGWGAGDGVLGEQDADVADEWNAPQQLVLLNTSYTPYTNILPPLSNEGDYKEVSNIIWLRPTGEEELLRSLSNIGYIVFGSPSASVPLKD